MKPAILFVCSKLLRFEILTSDLGWDRIDGRGGTGLWAGVLLPNLKLKAGESWIL